MILLLFLLQGTTNVSGSFSADIWINTPALYSLDLGYGNPALANGLNGFTINPAALSEIKSTEFTSAVSFASKSGFNLPLVFDMGEEIGEVEVSCNFSLGQPARVNIIAVGMETFLGKLGIGFIDGFGAGGELQGQGVLYHAFNDTVPDTLTTAEIPELSEDVPVEWVFSIPFKATLDGNTGIDFSDRKLFIGLANSLGPFRTGLGLAYRPIRGKITVDAVMNTNAPCTLHCSAPHGDWTINATGNAWINEDIGKSEGEISLTGNEFNLLAGMQLKLGPLLFGGTIKLVPATALKISGGNKLTYINDIPDISIDTVDVDVDTTKKILDGNIGVKLSDFPDTTETDGLEEEYELVSRADLQAGAGIKLGPFTAGLGAGLSLPSGGFYVNSGIEVKIIIPVRASIDTRMESYQVKDADPIFIPYYTINFGTSLPLGPLTVDLGIGTNLFSNLFSNLDIEEEETPELLFTPVIGINLKF